jgi:transposase, IS5 family
VQRAKNCNKSRVRSKVEHVFAVIKLKFGYVKVRYRGIKKNANQVFALCALSNLFLSRQRLLYMSGDTARTLITTDPMPKPRKSRPLR